MSEERKEEEEIKDYAAEYARGEAHERLQSGKLTEAEIFREVALAAIKSTWHWKMTTLILLILIVCFSVFALYEDHQKIRMLQHAQYSLDRNYNAFKGNERWDKFLHGGQHTTEIKKNCVQHHSTPAWETYPQIPDDVNR